MNLEVLEFKFESVSFCAHVSVSLSEDNFTYRARGTPVQQAYLTVIYDIFSVYFFGLDPNSHSSLHSYFPNTYSTVL